MQSKIASLAESYPVLVVSGPRQSGKSTLVRHVFPKHSYVNLENLDEQMMALEDPRSFLDRFKERVIIDEIQQAPGLLSYIQGIVDENKRNAQFVLTGSSSLDILQGVSQSLAGRASVLELLPLCRDELISQKDSLEETLFLGSYPSIHFDDRPVVDWYQDYCSNYLERDVRRIVAVKNLGTFRLFLKMCAARCGQAINYTAFANDCGISPNTVKGWMNILEASFIIFRLYPYYKNYSKRLVKSPKLYFYDTGVACSLLDITEPEALMTHSLRGSIFESWVIGELKKKYANVHRNAPLYYWKNNQGTEIDLIVEKLEQIVAVEIKSGKTLSSSFFKGLHNFSQIARNDVSDRYLVYGGEIEQVKKEMNVFSWKNFAQAMIIS